MTEIHESGPPLSIAAIGTEDAWGEDSPRVHLLMEPGRDRRLLKGWLEDRFEVTAGTDGDGVETAVDLFVVDRETYRSNEGRLKQLKREKEPVFVPVLVLVRTTNGVSTDIWQFADDVIERPIRKAILENRMANLLRQRKTSTLLAEREQRLTETVSELHLKERSMDAAPIGVTITDPSEPDNPAIYANAAFERLTGYATEEVLGRNMRFLQGMRTDAGTVDAIKEAIRDERPISVTILNYRKDGSRFWNRLDIAPVRDKAGKVTAFVGFQSDVTDQKINQQRLTVLNRLIRHNLSNDINVIDGFTDILLEAVDNRELRRALEKIKGSAEELKALGEDASRIERMLSRNEDGQGGVWDIGETLASIRTKFKDEHPEIDISVVVEDGPWYVQGVGFDEVIRELVENAVIHNRGNDRRIDITIGPLETHDDRFFVRIEDNGPGLPPGTVEILENGEETPLQHTDGLGLWMVSWLVENMGGNIDITSAKGDGTVVRVTLPSHGSRN